MGLFISKDNSFCSNKECEKQDSCKRHIKHYPTLKEQRLSFCLIEDSEKCEMYLKI